jgi:hypothetical protein
MKTRMMYFEFKGDGINGLARIGRLTLSKSGKSLYYQGRRHEVLKTGGYTTNYFDSETGEEVWISGYKKKGGDRLHPGIIEFDEDVREEYWTEIRKMPEEKNRKKIRCPGKYGGE